MEKNFERKRKENKKKQVIVIGLVVLTAAYN